MIHSLKIKNFFSIQKEEIINFEVPQNSPDTNVYKNILDKKISNLNLIVGGNGAGKTNFMRAFAFIQWFITGQRNLINNKLSFPFSSWFIENKKTTELEIIFSINNIIYEYIIHFSHGVFIYEKLSSTSNKTERNTKNILFEKIINKKIEEIEIQIQKGPIEDLYKIVKYSTDLENIIKTSNKGFLQNNIQSIVFLIANYNRLPIFVDILNYFTKMPITSELFTNGQINNLPVINLHLLNQNVTLKEKVFKILKTFDIGWNSFNVNIEDKGNGNFEIKDPMEIHMLNGLEYKNNLLFSSNGTRRLLYILHQILFCVENKVPCIIDEFDLFIHNSILEKIIDLAIEENIQLVISSQQHLIMNKFDKYQIHLVEKHNLISEIFRLDEVVDENGKPLRNTENFFLNYVSGKYGGINKV